MGLSPSGSPSGGGQLGTAGDAASAMAARRTRGARPLRRRIGRAAAGPLISRRAALVGSSPRRRAASQLWATARTNSGIGRHPRASTRSLAVADDTVFNWSGLV